jgi:hypothetical protein
MRVTSSDEAKVKRIYAQLKQRSQCGASNGVPVHAQRLPNKKTVSYGIQGYNKEDIRCCIMIAESDFQGPRITNILITTNFAYD